MKIEQKHNTKAPAYMAVAVLLATSTLASGCGTKLAGETTTEVVLGGETQTAFTEEVQLEGEAETVCYRDFYLDKSYFENVDKDYTLDKLTDEIGPFSSFGGSGMIHYNWILDDGSEATVYFGSSGKIATITIYDGEELIYDYNKYDDSVPRATLDQFFEAFAESDYEAMKAFCTESCIEDYFHDGDVNGMIWANITETENGRLKEGRWYYLVTVEMETTEDSELAGETTATFYVILVQDEDENWFINKFVFGDVEF